MLAFKYLKLLLICMLVITSVFADGSWYQASDGNSYYIDAQYKYNWYDSLYECVSRGLSLVSITTEPKNKALIDVLKLTGKDHYWIGAVGTPRDGKSFFFWVTSGEEFDYTYWTAGEPNGNGEEFCVHIDGYDYHWNDNNCGGNYFALLCEESAQVRQQSI